jgi:quercetin dioxygenase-like cupin family protein
MVQIKSAQSIWPAEILNLPQVEFPVSGVTGHSLNNHEKQISFLSVDEGTTVPDHSHAAQWGYLVAGEMTMEVEGRTELYQSGDVYYIPAGVTHRTTFSQDSFVIDMGDDPNRFAIMK